MSSTATRRDPPDTWESPPNRNLDAGVMISRRTALVGAAATGIAACIGLGSGEAAAGELPPLYRRCRFGTYADNEPWPNVYSHYGVESIVGANLRRMSWFLDMGAGWQEPQAAEAARTGHDLMIAWQPSAAGRPIPFSEILSGQRDAMLTSFFAKAATYPRTVILRPFWEMNANAATYSLNYRGPDRQVQNVDEWIKTWRYLVTLQRRVGGTRIRWFFCANGSDVGPVTMEQYYPGTSWIHEIGFDTYNDNWAPWTDFDNKVLPMYRRLTAIDSRSPVTIGEIGCKESDAPPGESKATWSRKMFLSTRFARLTNVCFFNADKEEDWRLYSSGSAQKVYRQYLPLAPGGRRS